MIDGQTTIKCRICGGSGKSVYAHPSHNAECGACAGSGLSTAPYDLPRNGTTVSIPAERVSNLQDAQAYLMTADRFKRLADVQAHKLGRTYPGRTVTISAYKDGIEELTPVLISWVNRDYAERAAQDARGELYQHPYYTPRSQ